MSWWVSLSDPNTGDVLELDDVHGFGGGTYSPGSRECSLNITYNYSPLFIFIDAEEGLKWLQGKSAADAIPRLKGALEQLNKIGGEHPYKKDYWAPTPGNVAQAIKALLAFAEAYPAGIFEVS